MGDFSGPWVCRLSRDQFARLRQDESFHVLLALARVVNSLRFMHQALLDFQDDDSPPRIRQRINSFIYTGAVLFEGIQLSKRLGKYFRTLESFSGFVAIHKDPHVEELFKDQLRRLRNEAVFHFDAQSIAASLQELDGDEIIFLRGSGSQQGNVYYDLADTTALHLLTGIQPSAEAAVEHSRSIVQRVTDLSIRFVKAADELICTILYNEGLEPETMDECAERPNVVLDQIHTCGQTECGWCNSAPVVSQANGDEDDGKRSSRAQGCDGTDLADSPRR